MSNPVTESRGNLRSDRKLPYALVFGSFFCTYKNSFLIEKRVHRGQEGVGREKVEIWPFILLRSERVIPPTSGR